MEGRTLGIQPKSNPAKRNHQETRPAKQQAKETTSKVITVDWSTASKMPLQLGLQPLDFPLSDECCIRTISLRKGCTRVSDDHP